jgi:hypothetical protein
MRIIHYILYLFTEFVVILSSFIFSYGNRIRDWSTTSDNRDEEWRLLGCYAVWLL